MKLYKRLFLFFIICSSSADGQIINQTKIDSSWIEKDSMYYCRVFSDQNNITIKECYSMKDSSILYIETYVDKKLTGIRNEYYSTGILKRHEVFLQGKIIGQFLEYNENGTLLIKGSFAEGDNGDNKEEYCGEILIVSQDNPGVGTDCCYCFSSPRQGKWTYYSDSGKKYSEGYYKDNKRIGEWLIYDIYTGKIEEKKDYGNGEK